MQPFTQFFSQYKSKQKTSKFGYAKHHLSNNRMQQSTRNTAKSCRFNNDTLLNGNCRVIRLYFIDQTLISNTSGNIEKRSLFSLICTV